MPRSTVAECPVDHETWPVFGSAPRLEVKDVVEAGRTEEDWHPERRVFDNRLGTSEQKTTTTFTTGWTRTVAVEREETEKLSATLGFPLKEVISIELSAEDTLRKKYAVSDAEEQTSSISQEIVVPAHTKRILDLHWRRVWQHGVVTFDDPRGGELRVPFKVLVDVRYNATVRDESRELP